MAEPKSTRPTVNFPAGIVTDHFLSDASHSIDGKKYEEEHQKLKEEVKKMLMGAFDEPWTKLDLIDAVQRLGVSYHFEKKIDELLQQMHADAKDNEEFLNLYNTCLGFRLLRQHGYKISCEMFKKFKNDKGKFKESLKSDVEGMLSLYEATHLRIHGEDILEEALAFTTNHLHMILSENLSPSDSVSAQIRHALSLPLHKNIPRLEARYFISVYEQDPSHSEILLTFAKLDFNILQKLHQKELFNLSRWWKELDVSKKLPFARDRIAECYFWLVGICFEPECFLDREIFTKLLALTSLVDDIYDAYGTREELEILTDAIQRWDINAANDLPECLKVFYEEVFLRIYNEIEQDLIAQGLSYRMHYAQQLKKVLARAYLDEANWFLDKKVPTMEEFMEVGLITSTGSLLVVASLLGSRNIAITKDVFDWILSYPKMITASCIILRFIDDIVTHEYEKETRGQEAASVQCYMKQHGVTKQEAIHQLQSQISNAWKDINEECLKPFIVPFPVLERIVNISRVAFAVYKDGDGYTFSQLLLKDDIASLLVDPVPISVSDM